MTCRDVEARLTAYLDGELDPATSSALRGHLRTCAACNAMAEDHARIAGALAAMHDRPLDPPRHLYDQILRRLGEAEEVDARRSPWALGARRFWDRVRPHLLPGAAVATAAVLALVWWTRDDRASRSEPTMAEIPPRVADDPPAPEVEPPVPAPPAPPEERVDVETALVTEAQRIDALYADVVEDLTADALEERATWTGARQRSFDAELARLHAAVRARPLVIDASIRGLDPDGDHGAGEARERAWQALVGFLQRAAVGDLLAEARR